MLLRFRVQAAEIDRQRSTRLDIEEILKDLKDYRPRRRGWTWQEIAEPLGADFWIGLPASEDHRVAELLPPDGLLAGFFFVCDWPKGPPFGILPEQLDELLTPNLERVEDAAVDDSISVFSGRERWQVWRRR